MLKIANPYVDQLEKRFYDIYFNDKYKFFNAGCYFERFELAEDTWSKHQFASVYGNDVIGYIEYSINRQTNNCYELAIINFSGDKFELVFGKDLARAFIDIFEKFCFNKISFSVVVGNPVEESYDKIVERFGGRVVGVFEKHVKLFDGKLYDEKFYEITANNYFKTIAKGETTDDY